MKAYMQHTEASIYRLSAVQFNIFGMAHKIMRVATAVVLLWLGVSMHSSIAVATICLMVGSWMLVSLNQIPKHKAKRLIDAAEGKFPQSVFTFKDNFIQLKSSDMTRSIYYDQIVCLAEDKDYFYLFISRIAAYMIDKSTVEPNAEKLQDFLSEKTTLQWIMPHSFWRTNIRDILNTTRYYRRKKRAKNKM